MAKVQYVYKDSIIVKWTCVSCGRSNTTEPLLYTTGGCVGHGPDEYCYCSPTQSVFETKCKCGIKTIVTV